jgi:hypothetical protein
MLILAGIGRYSVAFVSEEVVFSIGRAEFVLLNRPVRFVGETVYGTGTGIEAFAGQIVATGTCRIVVGKALVVASASVELTDGSVVGAGV